MLRSCPVAWVLRAWDSLGQGSGTHAILDCVLGSLGSLWLRLLKMASEMVILCLEREDLYEVSPTVLTEAVSYLP